MRVNILSIKDTGLSFQHSAKGEPKVEKECTHPSIVLLHDPVALFQGGFVVLCSHAFFQVIDYGEVGMVQVPGILHYPDAPIEISREAVAEIIGFGQGAAGKEGLVADKHSVAETFPVEGLGSAKPAHAYELPVGADNRRFSVNYVGEFVVG